MYFLSGSFSSRKQVLNCFKCLKSNMFCLAESENSKLHTISQHSKLYPEGVCGRLDNTKLLFHILFPLFAKMFPTRRDGRARGLLTFLTLSALKPAAWDGSVSNHSTHVLLTCVSRETVSLDRQTYFQVTCRDLSNFTLRSKPQDKPLKSSFISVLRQLIYLYSSMFQ